MNWTRVVQPIAHRYPYNNKMTAVQILYLASSFMEMTNKPLKKGKWNLILKQAINITKNFVETIVNT
jgi:hypothetical protein